MSHRRPNLRRFAAALLLAAGGGFFAFGEMPKVLPPERSLAFFNIHTRERLAVTYCSGGEYVPGALADVNRILRDPLDGTIGPIDPRLLDLLFVLRSKLGVHTPFHVISGYRSARSNESLRRTTAGVAGNSLHMSGLAIDIRLPGVPLAGLWKAALDLGAGGVGYYPDSDFIHVDIGPARRW